MLVGGNMVMELKKKDRIKNMKVGKKCLKTKKNMEVGSH